VCLVAFLEVMHRSLACRSKKGSQSSISRSCSPSSFVLASINALKFFFELAHATTLTNAPFAFPSSVQLHSGITSARPIVKIPT
jgi:hypothetical protein